MIPLTLRQLGFNCESISESKTNCTDHINKKISNHLDCSTLLLCCVIKHSTKAI